MSVAPEHLLEIADRNGRFVDAENAPTRDTLGMFNWVGFDLRLPGLSLKDGGVL